MYSGKADSVWSKKGATLSDKSAIKEFGLTQNQIDEAIKDGKLQYRINYVFANPYLKLVRSEVEALVDEKYGRKYLKEKKIKKELAHINKEFKMLKAKKASLEQRKAELLLSIDE